MASPAPDSSLAPPDPGHHTLPQRGAAKRASGNLAQQLKPLSRRKSAPERLSATNSQMSIDGSGDAQDISNPTYGIMNGADLLSSSSTTSDDAVMPERRKPTVQRTYGKKSGKTSRPSLTKAASDGSILSRSPSISSTPAAGGGNAAPSRKRGRQSDTTDAELGTAPKRKRSFVIVTIADTHKPIAKAPPKPKAKAAAPRPAPEPKKPKDPLGVGSLVWVRLGNDGRVLLSSETPGLWWPSTVQSSSENSAGVRLLGKSVPGGYKHREQTVDDLSSRSILSFRQGTKIRFGATTFAETGFDKANVAPSDSPSKPVASLQSIWEAGFADALTLDEGDDDDLPDADLVFSQPSSTPTPIPKKKVEARKEPKDAEKVPVVWRPDPKLSPGTLLLCRDTRQSQSYWPARINEVILPSKAGAPGKYNVTFCDGVVKNVMAEWMILEDQDAFLTCRLGSLAVDGEDLAEDGRKSPLPRSPSPQPRELPPTESEFEDYTFREQVACIRPVLNKIICGEYPPAQARHDAFISGGRQRQQLSQRIVTGDLSTSQLDTILHEIRRWALRGERWTRSNESTNPEEQVSETNDAAPTTEQPTTEQPTNEHPPPAEGQDTTMADAEEDWRMLPSEKVPRPKGCAEYESLGDSERSQYCSDVLLPEALVQLHALRRTMRTGKLLEDDGQAEQALYDAAAQSLAQEEPIDGWVDQILSRRQQRRIARGMPATDTLEQLGKGSNGSPAKGSTRSRRAYN
ncbi:hypothetical protein FS837_011294 [Tulasnella sp. UAMH 9824]|nr:hypothetical protein FS837_011294 [Tulasnella sp. UAMH 9824]